MDSFLWKMFSEVLCKALSPSQTAIRSKLFLIQIIIDCSSIILNQGLQKYFLNYRSFPVSQNPSQHHQHGWLDSRFQGTNFTYQRNLLKRLRENMPLFLQPRSSKSIFKRFLFQPNLQKMWFKRFFLRWLYAKNNIHKNKCSVFAISKKLKTTMSADSVML